LLLGLLKSHLQSQTYPQQGTKPRPIMRVICGDNPG
jgi:hypothetical protein